MEHPPEKVLVITARAAAAVAPEGFSHAPGNIEPYILDTHTFLDREHAETNETYKQVIPYVVVSHAGRYLLTQRTSQQQEKRLHNLYSIGQGGHINDLDMQSEHPIIAGMQREVAEEFHLAGPILGCGIVGMINDNSSPVGKVHLGLVYLLSVGTEGFSVAETGKHIAQWASVTVLKEHYAMMENWSKILMDQWLCTGTA